MIEPTEAIGEQAYLVARGVRPLALVGSCPTEIASQAVAEMMPFSETGAIPFSCDRGDGTTEYGFAAAPWVIDLYRWTVQREEADETVPQSQRHRIVGLLLGYHASAVSAFEESAARRRAIFASPA